jgi:RimJ/RimL family protein N-acetyltransferase
MSAPEVVASTPRLLVRRFADADLDAFVAYRAHPDVERYQSWSGYTRDDGRALLTEMADLTPGTPGRWCQLAVEDRASGHLVGDLALHVDPDEPRLAEIGFSFAPEHQGRGLATEAVQGLLGFTFGTLGLHRVTAVTDVLNTRSAALLERVGMRREAHLVENVFFKGAWGSELLYAMLDREWAARCL